MYIHNHYVYKNIVSVYEGIHYVYEVSPINTSFANESQVNTVAYALGDTIIDLNMPGTIIAVPCAIPVEKIFENHEELWQKNGIKTLQKHKEEYIDNLKKILLLQHYYNYRLFFIISDGRLEVNKVGLMARDSIKLSNAQVEQYMLRNKMMYNIIKKRFNVDFCNAQDIEFILNYLAIPFEGKVENYYTRQTPTHIEYTYKSMKSKEFKTMYTKTAVAKKFNYQVVKEENYASDVITNLHLSTYPIDYIVKWDLWQDKAFRNEMKYQHHRLTRNNKSYYENTGMRDKEGELAAALANKGKDLALDKDKSKIKYQLLLRVRASTLEMLEARYDALKEEFERASIEITYDNGRQEKLSEHLMFYRNTYRSYVHSQHIYFFSHLNYFGGLCIGEQYKGVVVGYTVPGKKPVLIDPLAPYQNRARTSAGTYCAIGQTGSGKSQILNNYVLCSLIFYGSKTLFVDPKGDHEKVIEYLGKENASHIILGSDECESGILDPYLISNDFYDNAKDESVKAMILQRGFEDARDILINLSRMINSKLEISHTELIKTHERMLQLWKDNSIKKLNLTSYLKVYKHLYGDNKFFDEIAPFTKDTNARLFFGTEDTKLDNLLSFDKPFNLFTFQTKLLEDSKKEVSSIEAINQKILLLQYKKVNEIIMKFLEAHKNSSKLKTIVLEECYVYQRIPSGATMLNGLTRIVRSYVTQLITASQSCNDFDSSFFEQVGVLFLGSIKSEAIPTATEVIQIGDNPTLLDVLKFDNSQEGLDLESKFKFILQDYNNRKAVIRLIFPEHLKDVFDTSQYSKEKKS